jgi:hypothetical protein
LEFPEVDWHAELRDQRKSEREILLEMWDELRRLDSSRPATEAALGTSLTRADGQSERKPSGEPTALMAETLEALGEVDEALPDADEAEAEGGPDAEVVEDALGAYVAAGFLDDGVVGVLSRR